MDELLERWGRGEKKMAIRKVMGLTPGQLSGQITRLNLHTRPSENPRRLHLNLKQHPAAVNGTTLFPSRVTTNGMYLKPGRWQTKLGSRVTKGPWAGMAIFSLTLEERATCPRSCKLWFDCYGNNMHLASRMQHGPELKKVLYEELTKLQRVYKRGFVVRLHVLGDFYSIAYMEFWSAALTVFPALHVFGYTAHQKGTALGDMIRDFSDRNWDRFAVRTSGANRGPRTKVVNSKQEVGDFILCPAQTGQTRSCGTCGLCWAPPASDRGIAFLRH